MAKQRTRFETGVPPPSSSDWTIVQFVASATNIANGFDITTGTPQGAASLFVFHEGLGNNLIDGIGYRYEPANRRVVLSDAIKNVTDDGDIIEVRFLNIGA